MYAPVAMVSKTLCSRSQFDGAVAGISATFVEIQDLTNVKAVSRRAHNNEGITLQRMKCSDIFRGEIG